MILFYNFLPVHSTLPLLIIFVLLNLSIIILKLSSLISYTAWTRNTSQPFEYIQFLASLAETYSKALGLAFRVADLSTAEKEGNIKRDRKFFQRYSESDDGKWLC